MILLLAALLTIHGVSAMRGESFSDVGFSEFVVSIWYFHEHKCSGSVLDRTHILTAGNCVSGLQISLLSVAAGIINVERRTVRRVPVKSIHPHPDFHTIFQPNDVHWENNIVVLKLSEELNWDSTIAAVPLVNAEYNWDPCDICGIFGWEDAIVDGVESLTLRWSQIEVMVDETCRSGNVHLSKNEKCSLTRFSSTVLEDVRKMMIGDLHSKDYGAAVICRGSAVGITISGGRNENDPPVLLSIFPYLKFIAEVIDVGSINIPYGNFQHYVAMFQDGFYLCGGSIIDSTHILTAAHCVKNSNAASLAILRGHSRCCIEKTSSSQLSFVARIQIHPDYLYVPAKRHQWTKVENDIAVVTLRAPLVWSSTINAIALPSDSTFGKACQLYRWTRTPTRHEETLLKSMWSSATILDHDTCKGINPLLDSNRFCTVNLYSFPIATKGDSGSPIICDGLLIGILSTHTSLTNLLYGPNQAIFFTAVFPYRKFISDAVADRTSGFHGVSDSPIAKVT